MSFVYRYDLSFHDIGIGHDTFVSQLMERGHRSKAPEELTEEEGKHLLNWFKGLFDADKEGLSNDVFSSCRPQDFYLIVPTLFNQTIAACSEGVFTFETIKGGLECKPMRLIFYWSLLTKLQTSWRHSYFLP